MHPPLDVPDRAGPSLILPVHWPDPSADVLHPACADVIAALEACHASGFLNRYLGGCNQAKHALTMCLRQEVR